MRSSIRVASSKKRMLFLSLLILLLCLSIGYAYLSEAIKVDTSANIGKMTWDVHLENIVVREGSVTGTPTIGEDKTSLSLTATFKNPGDYFEYYVDVVNQGSIDAQVESIYKTSLSANQEKYFVYSVTYKDGVEIKKDDVLSSGERETLKILVYINEEYLAYTTSERTLNLMARISYIQKDRNGKEKTRKSLYEQIRKETQLDTGINFGAISSDTNGKGVYTLSKSEGKVFPLYYYRGAVTNNNVLFGGFCWKVLRTTSTGGIKLIYNGKPTNGVCDKKSTAAEIGRSAFNTETDDAKYVGYMYDNNTRDSTIKGIIDTWFANNLGSYLDYLEDTPFYNERDYITESTPRMSFAPKLRIWGAGEDHYAENVPNTTIKLGASNLEDIFTVSNDIGNGKLTYPVGLITSDEVVLAGGRGSINAEDKGSNREYYLCTGNWYWTMSPQVLHFAGYAMVIPLDGEGGLTFGLASNNGGIRPVISLRSGAFYTVGDGTTNSPYVIFE